ncbi:hypothetical protein ACHAWU_008736 [Discostella pseudostelligera]|uniref:SCP domain-containing protein n=1 Tax=Discostella pseudostelligera TaxID=259834 RepID=A0ABD3MNP9_9STRA
MSVRSLSILLLAAVSTTLPAVISAHGNDGNDVVDGSDSPDGRMPSSSASSSSTRNLRRRMPIQQLVQIIDSNRDESIEESISSSSSSIRGLGTTSSNPLGRTCQSNQKYFKIDLRTDQYGFENSWTLQKRNSSTGGWTTLASGPPAGMNYDGSSSYQGGYCLSPGDYVFTITDLFKDGMCCSVGNGRYIGYVDGVKRFASPTDGSDWEKRSHPFTVSTNSSGGGTSTGGSGGGGGGGNNGSNLSDLPLSSKITDTTDRDEEWLAAHNTRRQDWHQRYGKSYVPLTWSNALKEQSRAYAETLLAASCGELVHDPNSQFGENLAAHSGTGSFAEVRTSDSIVGRWVDNEAGLPYPDNAHLTQALWRATKYVGCDEASKARSGGGMCYIQVCRYARPGNCNMAAYKDGSSDWWAEPMLADDSPCSPACPPDGC